MRTVIGLLLVLSTSLPLAAAAQSARDVYPLSSHAGVIEDVDFASSTMVVSGYRYAVATDAEVEIGGSYGAFTMLRPGMRIAFEYLHISGSERLIVLVREVPDGVVLEEA